MCDQIAIINHGEVIACEPTSELLQRLDKKALTIHPESELETVPKDLADLDASIRADGALTVTYHSNNTRVVDLLNRIREAGVRVKDLATEEPDLEDVFVEMTTASN